MYGCEVDYAVVAPGDLPPEIELKPRQPGDSPCDPAGTYLITSGKAPRKMPSVDFGELPLQRAKVMQVMLYNRTGIATPYSAQTVLRSQTEIQDCISSVCFESSGVKVDKNPAFDPLVKGRKIGDYLDAATRMYALINQSGGGIFSFAASCQLSLLILFWLLLVRGVITIITGILVSGYCHRYS